MNFRQLFIASAVLLLLSGIFVVVPAFAQDDPLVESATPSSAIQGTYDLEVEILGSNFGRGAIVRFLANCDGVEDTKPAYCDGPAPGVTVGPAKAKGSTKLTVTVNVSEDSYVGPIDVEVELYGRKGKGTTLFKVESRDSSTGNDNHIGRGMICTLNPDGEDPDNPPTVMDDGDPVYVNDVDQVLCLSGAVVSDNFSPLRFSNLPGGNPKQIKFAKRFLDLAFDNCIPADEAELGCNDLPWQLEGPGTPDTAYVHVNPYSDQDHIHLMAPGGEPYGMSLRIDPRDFERRFSIQMSSRNPGQRRSVLCYFDADGFQTTDDINVYVWGDGVYSGVFDGLPDGYTVTTGNITSAESRDNFPEVSPAPATALICSNIGPNGEVCADRKNRDDLCFVLGTVDMRFTLQMEYQ